MTDPAGWTAQDALVAVMVALSASDEDIRTAELVKINSAVNNLPIFGNYDADRLGSVSQIVFDLFEQEEGRDALFGLVRLPTPRLKRPCFCCARPHKKKRNVRERMWNGSIPGRGRRTPCSKPNRTPETH